MPAEEDVAEKPEVIELPFSHDVVELFLPLVVVVEFDDALANHRIEVAEYDFVQTRDMIQARVPAEHRCHFVAE